MAKVTADPRQRLLEAGLRLFANRSYDGASVQDIVAEARVTKPTLYYYFGNKEGLFQALFDLAMDERLRLMREAAAPEKETVDQLTDIIVALTLFARRRPDLLRPDLRGRLRRRRRVPLRLQEAQAARLGRVHQRDHPHGAGTRRA
ncbi:MAG: helix-turn-helix domain-containing protein [Verrucomicrobiota bacterium]